MTKEATIHFTEEKIQLEIDCTACRGSGKKFAMLGNDTSSIVYGGTIGCCDCENGKKKIELPLTPELEKLRLEAVIQKEAEEKYPEEKYLIATVIRQEYISWWQSLIERLPSEEEYEKIAWQWAVMYKEIKSKLLPSLPSTLSCEVEEQEGKVTVVKLWL